MSRIAWPRLMRAGLQELRLTPEQFWALTPAELMLLLGLDGQGIALDRARFDELSSRFPDTRDGREA